MTLQERGKLGNEAMRQAALERARRLRDMLERGECLKRAAHHVGISYRTAKRYRARWR